MAKREPGRGYSWPPFQPGHTLSLKHGARAPARIQPVADELRAWLSEVAPWADRPAFAATADAWAWAEARVRMVRSWLEGRPLVDADGEIERAATYLEALEKRAAGLRAQLALDPSSLVKLLGGMANLAEATDDRESLEALKAEGRGMAAAALAQLRSPPPAIPAESIEEAAHG